MSRLLPLLVLLACGADADDASGTDTGTEEVGLIGEDVPWPDKTDEEKHSWMTHRVKPAMANRFVAFDPTWEGVFDCGTCHGENTRVSDYGTMPHPDGPPALSRGDWPTESADQATRDIAAFMEDFIEPDMAGLLDTTVSPFGGINCGTCHVITD